MKASKALKRLAKIEASMSDLIERFSTNAPSIRKALRDAVAAIAVAKEAVGLEATSGMANDSPVKHPALKKAKAAKPAPAKKASKKATARKAAKTSTAKAAKKVAPVKRAAVKKAVKKSATKKTVPVAVHAVTEAAV